MKNLLFISSIIILFSCGKNVKNESIDTVYVQVPVEKIIVKKQEPLLEKYRGHVNFKREVFESFSNSFKVTTEDSLEIEKRFEIFLSKAEKGGKKVFIKDSIKIQTGFLFDKKQLNYLIQFHRNTTVFTRIFEKLNDKFIPILSINDWDMEFVKDTLFDVNNDGFSDFVIETYGTSGCCLKRTDFVWIYDAKNHRFNMAYDFLNPEYFPKIKTMISLSYGHPNEVHYCQMKWRANKLDTVEFIYKNGKKKVCFRAKS
jgi:hypothetical protein